MKASRFLYTIGWVVSLQKCLNRINIYETYSLFLDQTIGKNHLQVGAVEVIEIDVV